MAKKTAKKSRNTKNKNFMITIFCIFLIILFIFIARYSNLYYWNAKDYVVDKTNTFNTDNTENNRPPFSQKDAEKFITYDIPNDWKEVESDNYGSRRIVSPDIQETGVLSGILQGAKINFPRFFPYSKLGREFVYKNSPSGGLNPKHVDETLREYTLNGNKVMNYIERWEGAFDVYYIESDIGVWQVVYKCAECNTRQDFDNNYNTSALKYFLNSLKFDSNEE